MNRIEKYWELETSIVTWIQKYTIDNNIKSLVVGISGGIDSAVVSTLCAETGLPTYVLGMPICQATHQDHLSDTHAMYLMDNYDNVTWLKFYLDDTFKEFKESMRDFGTNTHALANTRSRLRMMTLYQVAGSVDGIVVGTGNKVEDYGVGFYTKYGDGGVDIAPIADLYKTEVWELGKHLGINEDIINASPTDGLWDDGRTDEDQLGATYEQIEDAMENGTEGPGMRTLEKFRALNAHKMSPIPTFKL
jgi:NAD+ synthase